MFVPDERHATLRDALTRLIIGLHPLDGPSAIVRVDPAPGFASMSSNDSPKHLNVTIEVGRVKNKNKDPVAEKAVRKSGEGGGGGYLTKFCTGRLRPEVQPLNLSYTILAEKVPLLYTFN